MMESYKDTSTNTKGGSYYNNHHNNNHKNKRNNRSNNKNANNGNNNNTTTEYQNSGNNNNQQRGGNKFANKTNTFLNNKNNNQGGAGGKQRRGSSNNYNNGHPTAGSTLNTSKSCNNGFIRHESFDDRLSKSFSKDKQSPNNSFVDYQLPTSYSFDNLNKQVRTPSKQSGQQQQTTNPYSFLSSNVDPYAKLSPSNKENDQPSVNKLSVSEQANRSKSTTPKGHEINDESISCYSTPLSQVDNNSSTTAGNNITLDSSGNTTLSSGETSNTSSQQYLSPPENKFNINDISEDSTTMSANHQDILNLINKDMLSPDSRSYNDEALVTASEGEGSFGQEATMNVEKTIISTSFDKAALDNLISNLDQQNQSGQVDMNDLNVQVAESSVKQEVDEEEEAKTSQDISDLVNKIVQEAVVKAKEMAEKEEEEAAAAAVEEKKNESFELIEKQELTEEDLKQIELEEKRSIELKEVKLTENNAVATLAVTPLSSPDKINKSVTFSPTRTEISQSVAYNGAESIDQIKSSPRTNGVNESNMSLNSAGDKQGKQKAAASDVDCFSCSIL